MSVFDEAYQRIKHEIELLAFALAVEKIHKLKAKLQTKEATTP